MKKLLLLGGLLCVLGIGGYFVLTAPFTWAALHPTKDFAENGAPNLTNGQSLFYAGSCGTCHATPGQKDPTKLGGGGALTSGFGTFYMPNISPDRTDGIGDWTTAQFVSAVREGVSRNGENLYPALPYTSYQHMTANDLRDLFGYIKTLPAVAGKARGNDLKFPFSIRRGIGLWKLVFLDGKPLVVPPNESPAWKRGQYLVEGPGHCAECHSPRNSLGAIVADKRFSGGPNPDGHGYVPNITPDDTGIGYWSQHEIATYLKSGVTPINTQVGGSMAPLVANMAHLSASDRAAMAEYVKSLPHIDAPNAGAPEPNRTAVIKILPKTSRAMESPASVLSGSPDALAKTKTLYTVAIQPFFLDRKSVSSTGDGDGKLLPAAKLEVIARDGDWLKVKVEGWRQDGSPAALYALEGKRILVAALTSAAVAKVESGKKVEDIATKLSWSQGSLTVWVANKNLNPDIAKVWAYSSKLYDTSCGACHAPHPTDSYLANQWIGSLKAMKRFAGLDDAQYRLLQAYLQFHSKDVDHSTGNGKKQAAEADVKPKGNR